MTSPDNDADTVRAAVASTSTCSSATVSILSALLLPNSGESDTTRYVIDNSESRVSSKRSTSAQAKGVKAGKSTRGNKSGGKQITQFSPKEKGILATEVINATLKALGACIKVSASIKNRSSPQDLMKESTRKALRRSNSAPQSPLEPRSLHRVSSSPAIGIRPGRTSSSASSTTSGIRATAECARVAFSCLRILQTSKTSCMSDLLPFQVENGMSALIGKLIILGLDDLALKELRILKRRLEKALKPLGIESKGKIVLSDTTSTSTVKIQNLAELLHFENPPDPGPCLNLAIATQLHALRLMASSKNPNFINTSLPALKHECTVSPTRLLLQAVQTSSMPTAKASKQLDTLSQMLLSLCPSVSSSEDEIALTPKLNPPPKVVLQLQLIAFQSRILWWNTAGHRGDVDKEVLDPFSKCLNGFARRSQYEPSETYEIALVAFQTVQEAINSYNRKSTNAMGSSLGSLYKILGSLAQHARCYDDAIQWIEKAQSNNNGSESDARRCSSAASLLAMRLMTAPEDSKVEELLMEIVEGISGPLKGATQDLEELLTEVSHARRVAISLLSKQRAASSIRTVGLVPDGVRQMCENLVLQCPRFTLRFLGSGPSLNAASRDVFRYEQRRKLVLKSAINTVDSALYLIKIFQCENRLTWDLMDSTLQDCLALLEGIGDWPEGLNTADDKEITMSYFVRISNLYYAQHLNMRRDAENPKDIQHVRPLRRSVDSIRNRPANEKTAAILFSKLERLAEIYRSIDRLDDARESLIFLRDELFKNGSLCKVATLASSEPVRAAWEQDEETSMLARAISMILKLEMKLKCKGMELSFCDPNWSVEATGAVLEHCLDVLSKPSKGTLLAQQNVFKRLLSLYDAKQFPVRRLRVTIRLLRADSNRWRDLIDDVRSLVAVAGTEHHITESRDSSLRPYLPHLQALASTILELQEDHPRIDLLKPHLATWCSILETSKDHYTLIRTIDDVPDLVNHLHSIADFLQMKGFCSVRVAVLRMLANINEIPRPDLGPDELVLDYSTLALQYLELGYSGKAGLTLDRAQSLVTQNGVSLEASLRVHLSHAEYLIAIGNLNKCEEILIRSQSIASQMFGTNSTVKTGPTTSDRSGVKQLVADAHQVYSLLAMERGAMQTALNHAKKSLRLNRFSWRCIAMQADSRDNTPNESRVDRLAEDISNLYVTTVAPQVLSHSNQALGPSLWASVNPLFRSLSHLSRLFGHHGMFRETMYYAVQAHQLVKMTNSPAYITSALVAKGSTWLNAGTLDQASEFLIEAKQVNISSGERYASILLNCNLGKLHGLLGSQDSEEASYEDAHAALDALTDANYIASIDRILNPAALSEEMSRLTIKPKNLATNRKPITTKKSQNRKVATSSKIQTDVSAPISDYLQLASLRGFLLRQKAGALMLRRRCDEALAVLKEADDYSRSQLDVVDQHIGQAKQLLLQAVELMMADPVYSTLQDSTISLPAIVLGAKGTTAASERISGARPSPPPKKPVSSLTARERARAKSPCNASFYDFLRQAHEQLSEAHSSAIQISSTNVIHCLSSLLNAVTILVSAAGPSKGKSLPHSSFSACSLEMARNIAREREQNAILDDVEATLKREEDLGWPRLPVSDLSRSNDGSAMEAVRFQKEYIDIIPPSWTVFSISMGDNQNELCVTKMQAGACPFVLRLPLGRNNSRDADEQVFDFQQGKTELHEIITAANYTSHSARELKGREAKVAWWEEREAIDVRMKELLENMENVWLGGFKGIFSQHQKNPDLLARFQKSFQVILDKHLPSRQNMGRKGKIPRVTLDPRIWELFIGLGDVTAEGQDFDEPLTDLLYFVVDVLQFHGERNALDEIDFDSVVIETLDALRCYHEGVLASSTGSRGHHTILILDKALHAFPWESLPCMDGLAVSRLPSLSCLKERLREQQVKDCSIIEGHYVDRASGAYILNPGGDLKSTQTTFENTLQTMSEWNGIVRREPSEPEFKESLESKDILLYFGHGSGAQYIRAKSIRRLEKCAVAILMGCSSGALNDAGDFEPYGPPMDYMLAGSHAVVVTLWDVTDQDIDRFAKSTFEHWGLFKSSESGAKAKGKKRVEQAAVGKEKLSLIEAVSKGREACNFKYLTAAAVCVYGIPVYIK